jgi:methionyl-tRNA synthetase
MKPTIEYPDFEKLELRVGEVVEAVTPDWSNKLLQFTVDFGPEIGKRTILSGIQKWYSPDQFLNKKYAFVVNLAERKMGQGVSQGMMLMADTQVDGEDRPTLVPFPSEVPVGTVIR